MTRSDVRRKATIACLLAVAAGCSDGSSAVHESDVEPIGKTRAAIYGPDAVKDGAGAADTFANDIVVRITETVTNQHPG